MKRTTAFVLSVALIAGTASGSQLIVQTGTYAGNAPDINWWGQA